TLRRRAAADAVAQQRQVPGEALFQVLVDLRQHGDVVHGNAAAVAQLRGAGADDAGQVGERDAHAFETSVEGLAVQVLRDPPETARVGEGQLLPAVLLDLLYGRRGQEGVQGLLLL